MAAEASLVVGIASGALTFAEYSVKAAKAFGKIRKAHGELPEDLQACEVLLYEFDRFLRRIQRFAGPGGQDLSAQEQKKDLDDLIKRSQSTVEDLLLILKKLKPKPAQRYKKWLRDAETTLKSLRKEGKIQNIRMTLEVNKHQLILLLLEENLSRTSSIESKLSYTLLQDIHSTITESFSYTQLVRSPTDNFSGLSGPGASDNTFASPDRQLRRQMNDTFELLTRVHALAQSQSISPNVIQITLQLPRFNPLSHWEHICESVTSQLARRTRYLRIPSEPNPRSHAFKFSAQVREFASVIELSSSRSPCTLYVWSVDGQTTQHFEPLNASYDDDLMYMLRSAYRKNIGWYTYIILYRLSRVKLVPLGPGTEGEISQLENNTIDLSMDLYNWMFYEQIFLRPLHWKLHSKLQENSSGQSHQWAVQLEGGFNWTLIWWCLLLVYSVAMYYTCREIQATLSTLISNFTEDTILADCLQLQLRRNFERPTHADYKIYFLVTLSMSSYIVLGHILKKAHAKDNKITTSRLVRKLLVEMQKFIRPLPFIAILLFFFSPVFQVSFAFRDLRHSVSLVCVAGLSGLTPADNLSVGVRSMVLVALDIRSHHVIYVDATLHVLSPKARRKVNGPVAAIMLVFFSIFIATFSW